MSVRARGTVGMSVWLACGSVRVCAHKILQLGGGAPAWGGVLGHVGVGAFTCMVLGWRALDETSLSPPRRHPNFA